MASDAQQLRGRVAIQRWLLGRLAEFGDVAFSLLVNWATQSDALFCSRQLAHQYLVDLVRRKIVRRARQQYALGGPRVNVVSMRSGGWHEGELKEKNWRKVALGRLAAELDEALSDAMTHDDELEPMREICREIEQLGLMQPRQLNLPDFGTTVRT